MSPWDFWWCCHRLLTGIEYLGKIGPVIIGLTRCRLTRDGCITERCTFRHAVSGSPREGVNIVGAFRMAFNRSCWLYRVVWDVKLGPVPCDDALEMIHIVQLNIRAGDSPSLPVCLKHWHVGRIIQHVVKFTGRIVDPRDVPISAEMNPASVEMCLPKRGNTMREHQGFVTCKYTRLVR